MVYIKTFGLHSHLVAIYQLQILHFNNFYKLRNFTTQLLQKQQRKPHLCRNYKSVTEREREREREGEREIPPLTLGCSHTQKQDVIVTIG